MGLFGDAFNTIKRIGGKVLDFSTPFFPESVKTVIGIGKSLLAPILGGNTSENESVSSAVSGGRIRSDVVDQAKQFIEATDASTFRDSSPVMDLVNSLTRAVATVKREGTMAVGEMRRILAGNGKTIEDFNSPYHFDGMKDVSGNTISAVVASNPQIAQVSQILKRVTSLENVLASHSAAMYNPNRAVNRHIKDARDLLQVSLFRNFWSVRDTGAEYSVCEQVFAPQISSSHTALTKGNHAASGCPYLHTANTLGSNTNLEKLLSDDTFLAPGCEFSPALGGGVDILGAQGILAGASSIQDPDATMRTVCTLLIQYSQETTGAADDMTDYVHKRDDLGMVVVCRRKTKAVDDIFSIAHMPVGMCFDFVPTAYTSFRVYAAYDTAHGGSDNTAMYGQKFVIRTRVSPQHLDKHNVSYYGWKVGDDEKTEATWHKVGTGDDPNFTDLFGLVSEEVPSQTLPSLTWESNFKRRSQQISSALSILRLSAGMEIPSLVKSFMRLFYATDTSYTADKAAAGWKAYREGITKVLKELDDKLKTQHSTPTVEPTSSA